MHEGDYFFQAMNMPKEIVDNPEITKNDLMAKMTELEEFIRALQFIGHQNIETRLIKNFVHILVGARYPALSTIAQNIKDDEIFTMLHLRDLLNG